MTTWMLMFMKSKMMFMKSNKKTAFCWTIFDSLTNKDGTKNDTNTYETSTLNKHACKCAKKLSDRQGQTNLQFHKQVCGEGSSVITWKHDEVRIKKAMLNLFVVGELPFKFVENDAIIEYTNALNGKDVKFIYHLGIRLVVMLLLFINPNNTIHLTTDSWTSSCKKENYLLIPGHFIDDNWVMHKRILNFRPLDSHVGEDIGCLILNCINV
ncbi:hypothetical protein LXL04_004024 [Taraxacum kok-saghyz]